MCSHILGGGTAGSLACVALVLCGHAQERTFLRLGHPQLVFDLFAHRHSDRLLSKLGSATARLVTGQVCLPYVLGGLSLLVVDVHPITHQAKELATLVT